MQLPLAGVSGLWRRTTGSDASEVCFELGDATGSELKRDMWFMSLFFLHALLYFFCFISRERLWLRRCLATQHPLPLTGLWAAGPLLMSVDSINKGPRTTGAFHVEFVLLELLALCGHPCARPTCPTHRYGRQIDECLHIVWMPSVAGIYNQQHITCSTRA